MIMATVTERVDAFLRKYDMEPERVELKTCTQGFLSEMSRGLKGESTPVLMLPAYLTLSENLPMDQPVIVVDAGGTNFRVALVTMTGEGPRIEGQEVYPMPGSLGPITRELFLDQVADYILPYTARSKRVGFCFSYAAEILPNGDGMILDMSKQVQVKDAKGLVLGEEISKTLAAKGAEGVRFVVVNDTVAALLGGAASLRDECFDGYVGLIYGTGVNTCYAERRENITKLTAPWREETMILNMESGGFTLVPQGAFDRELDLNSVDVGKCLYEKMVSGRYQGEIIDRTLRRAVGEGLFSPAFASRLEAAPQFGLTELDVFCARPYGSDPVAALCETEEDREMVYAFVDRSTERAARLVCANVAAVVLQGDMGRQFHRPACVVAEGSTFHKGQLFRDKLTRLTWEYITETLGRHLVFRKAENANLAGTAAAALGL